MSQSSKSPVNTNIVSESSIVKVENKPISEVIVSRTPKRGLNEQVNDQVKKIKTENGPSKSDTSKNVQSNDKLHFVTASKLIANNNRTTTENNFEISDEELLSMAIEFEKEHPEYN